MANQVVIPFPNVRREVPGLSRSSRGARILARLSTARDVVRAVIETLQYLGDARVKRPLLPPPPVSK